MFRIATNHDMFHRLLLACDPIISLRRMNFKVNKKKRPLTREMLDLLKTPINDDDDNNFQDDLLADSSDTDNDD